MSKRAGIWTGAVAALLIGCGSSGGSDQPPPLSNPGGSSSYQCVAGQDCGCAGGLSGTTTCEHNREDCDCSACAAEFPSPTTETFDACGGEPFGVWRLVSAQYSKAELQLQKMTQAPCGGVVTDEKSPLRMLFELKDGGDANVYAGDSLLEAKFPAACWESIAQTCNDYGCVSDDCGLCTCSTASVSFKPDVASWSRKGSELTLTSGQFTLATFDYCVNGDEMSLFMQGTQTRFELQRSKLAGQPKACADRKTETCVQASEGSPDACHVGVCSGANANCAAAEDEAHCTNQKGCSWEDSGCAGTPASDCLIGDYGLLDGCTVAQQLVCRGTSQACADFTKEECSTHDGCTLDHECAGDKKECTGTWPQCGPGCTCTPVQGGDACECSGMSDCPSAKTLGDCQAGFECTWTPTCIGSLPDCSTLDDTQCEQVPGCRLEAPP